MNAKRTTTQPVLLRLSFVNRVRVLLGYRVLVVFETKFAIYDPKPLSASTRVAVIPPWLKKDASLAGVQEQPV